MIATRRAVLAGLAAAAASVRGAGGSARPALDEAAALPPAVGLARLAGVQGGTAGERLDLAAARSGLAIDAALAQRFPARAAQRAALVALRDRGTPGARGLPDGGTYLLLELRRQLGDDVALDLAERRLATERRRIEAAARRLFGTPGTTAGTTGDRYRALWRDERFLYPDDDAGRAAAVADMNATLATLRPRVDAACGFAPPPCIVRALTAAEIAQGKGGFRQLPTGGEPGFYAVDLKEVRRRPRWTLPSVVAHELLPGHLLQLPVEALTPPHPLRVTYATAFVEGWGIYAETLAARWDLFDAPALLGHLHWLLFRLCRAEADLGIHRHGWTLDRARAQLVAVVGEPAYFAPFDTDLARIAVEPGVRAAEALAWLGIADRARGRGGRYHRAVLAGGRRRLEQLP